MGEIKEIEALRLTDASFSDTGEILSNQLDIVVTQIKNKIKKLKSKENNLQEKIKSKKIEGAMEEVSDLQKEYRKVRGELEGVQNKRRAMVIAADNPDNVCMIALQKHKKIDS